ncbi:metal-dependent hydrolase [Mycobacterium colombiense]|uniref:metal-dependent hydrolase n=1 Tax=Mycobacterium colombiense TaxID=339268 RepID=UPI0007EC5CC8|nr:metal-dependent hydrolase [Mycobacterium colombiense]OBJ44944.1 metal-dependent hydrolase [Mycobacterium colombiense]OBJ68978.1 metal-dependent hydrolase [Mycobacterium colombiense]
MTDLEIRRIRFDLDGEVPFNWNAGNPAFSTYMNMVSIMAICFEKMLVSAVREAMPRITGAAVADEAEAFLRQEAQHANAHRQHIRALARSHPGLQVTLDEAVASYDHLTETTPLDFRLAYVADLEATFTPFFKMLLDNEATLFRHGDERVASLLMWHFVEEVEHRSSALVVYNAVVDDKLYRLRVLPRVVKHLMQVTTRLFDSIDANVPLSERGVDARDFAPLSGILGKVRARRDADAVQRAKPALHTVPWKQKLGTAARVLMSQTPLHDPAKEPLPEFADRWFERYNRGDDVCHWYSSELAT